MLETIYLLTITQIIVDELQGEIDKQSEVISSYRQNVEFLEQAHLSKAKYYESRERSMKKQIEDLRFELETAVRRETDNITKEQERRDRWKHKAYQFKDMITLVKANGDKEWLNVYRLDL